MFIDFLSHYQKKKEPRNHFICFHCWNIWKSPLRLSEASLCLLPLHHKGRKGCFVSLTVMLQMCSHQGKLQKYSCRAEKQGKKHLFRSSTGYFLKIFGTVGAEFSVSFLQLSMSFTRVPRLKTFTYFPSLSLFVFWDLFSLISLAKC